jgi:hypothetical protein
MNATILILCAAVFLLLAVLFLRGKITYRISTGSFKILLFGVCLRRVPFEEIKDVNKRRKNKYEHWPNTYFPKKRIMMIHLRSGKSILITPEQRYVFRSKLKAAIEEYSGATDWEESADEVAGSDV